LCYEFEHLNFTPYPVINEIKIELFLDVFIQQPTELIARSRSMITAID